ncbi:sulfotransferase [Paralimibaculum aggregatum]|uniref:Sulfotransferase n=1 Tax=Paralimibaculum aggregatum TaxID=3036245 RepID=A0ABQ6LD36_9RHOB|nr:sulfotransferase [Limibaculum sp. NKW23]GMG81270.1 sulfotransferase [Limibaculum sp. NKW23]
MAHPLSGADPDTLARVFAAGGRPDRWGQALGIWGAALARAPLSGLEALLLAGRLPKADEIAPPVFILGHWRSGTTHLYNTLVHGGFGYVPPLATGLPWDMFGLARALRPLLERQLPETRYIDAIPVTPTSPQEDEIAVANMSPLSFYHGIYFPRAFDRLIDRGLFFDGCSAEEIAAWERRFTYLMRKLALDQGARLMIKNPVYTARPARLARMFPGAKFVHIHRSPFDVFLSMRNFYDRLLAEFALQDVPEGIDIDATILRVYARMMASFDAETAGWDRPDFVELPYDLLDERPMEALARIYEALELPGFAAAEPRFAAYLESVRSFRKNAFRGDRAAVEKVSAACAPWIERWGYGVPEPAA